MVFGIKDRGGFGLITEPLVEVTSEGVEAGGCFGFALSAHHWFPVCPQ